MPKSRPPYPAEFKKQIVELVRAGRSPEDLAKEFEPSAQSIRTWVKRRSQANLTPPPQGHRLRGFCAPAGIPAFRPGNLTG
jgi:transposase